MDNADKLQKAIGPYLEKAQRVGGRRSRPSSSSSSGGQVDTKAVRAWAASNGIGLSNRGRVPADVIEKYKDAGQLAARPTPPMDAGRPPGPLGSQPKRPTTTPASARRCDKAVVAGTAPKYSNAAVAQRVQGRPITSRRARTAPSCLSCRPFASRGYAGAGRGHESSKRPKSAADDAK